MADELVDVLAPLLAPTLGRLWADVLAAAMADELVDVLAPLLVPESALLFDLLLAS